MSTLLRIVEASAAASLLTRRWSDDVELPPAIRARVLQIFGADLTASQVVDQILEQVRAHGDGALHDLTRKIDGVELASLEVSSDEIKAAYDQIPSTLVDALETAARQIRDFHQKQMQRSWVDFSTAGALGQIMRPISSVGVYAPGGTAPYPSTLLMEAIPARVAGVERVNVASPPQRNGKVSPLVLVAADIAGVDRVFSIGGAQAIAALAYGTATVPRVDKILGPGNIFVTMAKKKVFGMVGIDQLAGPTETLIIADETARPSLVAADLLAQAEHDLMASAILVTTSRGLAEAVAGEVEAQIGRLERAHIVRESIARNGAAVVVGTLAEAVQIANEYAPEHLCLLVGDPWPLIGSVRNAGGIFVGEQSPEVMGDYVAGPSHVMPTGGTARFYSPINILDFVKVISLIALSEAQMGALGPAAVTIARAEGLTAHAAAVEARLKLLSEGQASSSAPGEEER